MWGWIYLQRIMKKKCIDRPCIMEDGDPTAFDSHTIEWINVLLGFFEKSLDIPLHLHFTDDINHFNLTSTKETRSSPDDWAGVDPVSGMIYLSPERHMTSTKTQLLNSIYHECLHLKYPKMKEEKIRAMANRMVRIIE